MILDAETFEQVAAVDRIIRRRRGAGRCPGASRRSCSRRSSRRTPTSARRSRRWTPRCRRCGAPPQPPLRRRASRSPRLRRIPFAKPKGSRSSRSSATSASSPMAASPCAGRASRACTCTSACRRGGLLALPRVDPALVAGRARAVGELALVLRRADRDGVEPRAGARRAAACRRPSRLRLLRGVGVVGRAARRARRDAGLHADLVGRSPASRPRHARGSHPGPADRRAAVVGVRCAAAGDVRDCARRRAAARRARCSAIAAAPTTSRTAGRQRAPGRTPSSCIPTGDRVASASSTRRRAARARAPRRARTRRRVRARPPPARDVRGRAAADVVSAGGRGGSRRPLARLTW